MRAAAIARLLRTLLIGGCACLWVGADCKPAPSAVVVMIDADEKVRAKAHTLHWELWLLKSGDLDCNERACWEQHDGKDVTSPKWPVKIPVSPGLDTSTAGFQMILQVRDADDNALVEERVVEPYVRGQGNTFRRKFDGQCLDLGRMCEDPDDARCHGSLCGVCREGQCGETGVSSDAGLPDEAERAGEAEADSDG